MTDAKPPESKTPEGTSVPPKADLPSTPADASPVHKPEELISSIPVDAFPSGEKDANAAEQQPPKKSLLSIPFLERAPKWVRILSKIIIVLFAIAILMLMCSFGLFSLLFIFNTAAAL